MAPQDLLVLVPLVVATLFVTLRAWMANSKYPFQLNDRMGGLKWDFQDSWASNFTVVGAVLVTVLTSASTVAPNQMLLLTSSQYAATSLLFAVVVVAGAVIYGATCRPTKVDLPTGGTDVQQQGWVWSFLVAALLTLWAVLGQVLAVLLLVLEMQSQQSLSILTAWIFGIVIVATGVTLFIYTWLSVADVIQYQAYRQGVQDDEKTRLALARETTRLMAAAANAAAQMGQEPPVQPKSAEELSPPLKEWSML